MSHELRTPFHGVLGNLELLQETLVLTEQKELLHTARTSTEKLLNVINNILHISKLEAGKVVLKEIPFNVENLIEGKLRRFRNLPQQDKH